MQSPAYLLLTAVIAVRLSHAQLYQSQLQQYNYDSGGQLYDYDLQSQLYDYTSRVQQYDYDSAVSSFSDLASSDYIGGNTYSAESISFDEKQGSNRPKKPNKPNNSGPANSLKGNVARFFSIVAGGISNYFESFTQLGSLTSRIPGVVGLILAMAAVVVAWGSVTAPLLGSGRGLDIGDWDNRHSFWLEQTHFAEEDLPWSSIGDAQETSHVPF